MRALGTLIQLLIIVAVVSLFFPSVVGKLTAVLTTLLDLLLQLLSRVTLQPPT